MESGLLLLLLLVVSRLPFDLEVDEGALLAYCSVIIDNNPLGMGSAGIYLCGPLLCSFFVETVLLHITV